MALWAVCLCCQIIQMSHTLWLDCSHHVLVQRQLTASTVAYLAIEAQFCLGLQHLLPKDHFCITPGPHGFSLDQVLALNHEDQQLWLQSVQHTSKDSNYFNLHSTACTNSWQIGCNLPTPIKTVGSASHFVTHGELPPAVKFSAWQLDNIHCHKSSLQNLILIRIFELLLLSLVHPRGEQSQRKPKKMLNTSSDGTLCFGPIKNMKKIVCAYESMFGEKWKHSSSSRKEWPSKARL